MVIHDLDNLGVIPTLGNTQIKNKSKDEDDRNQETLIFEAILYSFWGELVR